MSRRIDYLVITHYHDDHVGGLAQLGARLKFKTLITHGPNIEKNSTAVAMAEVYRTAMDAVRPRELVVKPGDVIPIKGSGLKWWRGPQDQRTAAGAAANPSSEARRRSARRLGKFDVVSMLTTFGEFRFVDLGDLTQDREFEMACPVNRIGPVDLYLTTHHGSMLSGAEVLVHGLKPRAAIMNDGGSQAAIPGGPDRSRRSPGLQDLWMMHYAVAAGAADASVNVPSDFIANTEESTDPAVNDKGFGISVSAESDGSFTVTNERNKLTKKYK